MLLRPKGDDGRISRLKMPQVAPADIPILLSYLGSFDIGLKAGVIKPDLCKSHQAIDTKIAMAISKDVLAYPVIISADNYIIDGNHRWYRHLQAGTLMPHIQILENFEEALSYIMTFPKTYEDAVA